MNWVSRYGLWALPVIAGVGVWLGFSGTQTTVATASTHVGPTSFDKYAMTDNNNPVDESASVANWQVRWTYTAPEPLQQASIANGVIYASGDGGNLTDPQDDRIYALDAANGTLLWSRQLNNMSMTTPVVGDGLVFVGSGNQLFQGNNLANENNLNATNIVRGTGPNAIYALDAANGHVVWKFSTPGEDMPSFVLKGNTLYAANGNGTVYAFNATSGQLLWSLNIGSYVSMSSPVLGPNGYLYVSGAHPYQVYAINTATRQIAWQSAVPHVFGGSDDSSLAYAANMVYVEGTTGSWTAPQSVLYAFNATSGRLDWMTQLGSGILPTDIEVSAPTVVNGTVYVGSPVTDKEYAVNAHTGQIEWAFKAAGGISESAAVTSSALYVGDSAGFLYALNPTTGQELGSRFLSGTLAADFPIVIGQTLYQPDENGQMFALPTADLLLKNEMHAPNIPIPSGVLGQDIQKGEALFMGHSLSPTGLSCDSCHVGGGTLTTYQNGIIVPSLLGAAAGFPKVVNGQVKTLDGQINHCIKSMGGKPLSVSDPRLVDLNLYLHWLSSGWTDNLEASTQKGSGAGGGCK